MKLLQDKVDEYKTPEDAMQKSIDGLLEQHASTIIVTDRKTVGTDIVVFDFEAEDGIINILNGENIGTRIE